MREIKNIYLGLPFDFAEKVFWVDEEFRTNALSHQEGGFDIVVEYHSGEIFGYNRVKFPPNYIAEIFDARFSRLKKLSRSAKLDFIKSKVSKIFARKSVDEKKYGIQHFKEVWNSENATQDIAEALENLMQIELRDNRPPAWVAGPTLTVMDRAEGKISEDGLTITFRNFPKDLARFNDKPLELRGKGAVVRVCIAKAVRDSEDDNIKKGRFKNWLFCLIFLSYTPLKFSLVPLVLLYILHTCLLF